MPLSFSILLYAFLEQVIFFFCPCNTTHLVSVLKLLRPLLLPHSKKTATSNYFYIYVCMCKNTQFCVSTYDVPNKPARQWQYAIVPQNRSKWSSALSETLKPSSMFLYRHHKYMMVVLSFEKLRLVLTTEAYLIPIKSQTTPYVFLAHLSSHLD